MLLALLSVSSLLFLVPTSVDAQSWFRRGDANGDGRVDLDDATAITEYLFVPGGALPCLAAADVDANGLIDNADPLSILNWLNGTGPVPSAPGPDICGPDPVGAISCQTYSCAFIRGDANGDGAVGGPDVTAITNFIFNGGSLACLDAADVNDDGVVDNADILAILGGAVVPLPGPLTPGPDYTEDALDCRMYGNPPVFIRGDVDGDTQLTMNDNAVLLAFLFQGGTVECVAAADANGDGLLLNDDSIFILNHLTLGGPPPPAPYPVIALDLGSPLPCETPQGAFIRGDVDGNHVIDAADVAALNQYLNNGAPIPCEDAADADDNGVIDLADVVLVLNTSAGGGALPASPGPFVCGPDPTADTLGCASYTCIHPADFRRGDCNTDGLIDIADPITILGVLFPGPTGPPMTSCHDACDTNDDGVLNIADAVNELSLIFLGGMALPAPYPDCGYDATPIDPLWCVEYLQAGCP